MPTLHIRLLGELRLTYDDEPVTSITTPRLQSLLAYLLLHRETPQPRHHIAFRFWPASTESQARTNLRKLLYLLRDALPDADQFLDVQTNTLQWRPEAPFTLDVAEFERAVTRGEQAQDSGNVPAARESLEAATEYYRGQLLPSCYDDWILQERDRLQQLFSRALDQLIQLLEQQRDYPAAIRHAQHLLRHDPVREATYRRLMRLRAVSGDRAGALRVYHTCTTVLQRELDVAPGAETRKMYERLLAAKESTLPSEMPVSTMAAAPPLVGRHDEWERLQTAWRRATEEEPHVALIVGEAGVGKTRLAEEMLDWAGRQGIATARTRSYAAEGRLAYAPVTNWLRADAIQQNLHEVDDVWLTEVARLVPELLTQYPDLPTPGPLTEEWQHQRLFEALARAVLAGAQPLLLLIDDLQWCDHETLTWLPYLLRVDTQAQLLIVGGVRPEEVAHDHPLRGMQLALRREDRLTHIDLGRLGQDDTAALAAHVTGHDVTTNQKKWLYQETEGNPLFIVEMARAGLEEELHQSEHTGSTSLPNAFSMRQLPEKIQTIIDARLTALSPDARELAGAAAVIGREFSFDELAQVTDWDEDALIRGLDELWVRRIVREQGETGYDFSHDKIRDVAYSNMSRGRRRVLHRRVAAALQMLRGDQSTEIAGELAVHYLEAGDDETAVEYLLQAGDQARGLYAHDESVAYYQRALALLKQRKAYNRAARTLMKLGLTYHNALDFERARQAYDQGFALWQQAGHVDYARENASSSETLRVNWPEPETLDPAKSANYFVQGLHDQLFSGLVEITPTMDIVPAVALDWEISDDGRTYVFHLRDDAYWSDGVKVTAFDFEYAWLRVLDPTKESPGADVLYDVRGAEAFHRAEITDADQVGIHALDERTLRVVLDRPVGHFLYEVATPALYPVARHRLDAHGDKWAEPDKLITNGPFRLDSWDKERSMTLLRNSEYRGLSSGNVQQVELTFKKDFSAKLAMYEAGDLDVLHFFGVPDEAQERLRQRYAGEYVSVPQLGGIYLGFDTAHPPFDDVRIRRAFAYATDRETLTSVVMQAAHFPATGGMIPPRMPGHSAGIGLPYDPDRARHLLAEAGYPDGQGFPSVEFVTWKERRSAYSYLVEQWQTELGIDIHWKTLGVQSFFEALSNTSSYLYTFGWTASLPDPGYTLVEGFHPFTRWQNSVYDRLIAEARRTRDQEKRVRLYQRADKILIEEAPVVPLTYWRFQFLAKPWVTSYPTAPIKDWFLKDVVIERNL